MLVRIARVGGAEVVARAEQGVVRGRVLEQLLRRVDVAVGAAERRGHREAAPRVHASRWSRTRSPTAVRAAASAKGTIVPSAATVRSIEYSNARSLVAFAFVRSEPIVWSSSGTPSAWWARSWSWRKMRAYGSRREAGPAASSGATPAARMRGRGRSSSGTAAAAARRRGADPATPGRDEADGGERDRERQRDDVTQPHRGQRPSKLRRPLLAEGGHALDEVGRRGGERLVRALELERGGEVGLEARVEELLRQAERTGRAGGESGRELLGGRRRRRRCRRRSGTRARGRRPRRRCSPRRACTIALARGRPTSRGRRYAPPASATRPHLWNDQRNLRRGPGHDEVAGEREVRARADRGAVHRGDRRLVHLPQLADERLHADAQRLGGGPRVEAGLARPARRSTRRGPCPRRTRRRWPASEERPHRGIGAAGAQRVDDAVAHRDRERVLRVGPVERDAADAVVAGLDVRGARVIGVMRFRVRMLTTLTPEPRPPTLCWSAKPLRSATCRSPASSRSCHQHSVICAMPVAPIG